MRPPTSVDWIILWVAIVFALSGLIIVGVTSKRPGTGLKAAAMSSPVWIGFPLMYRFVGVPTGVIYFVLLLTFVGASVYSLRRSGLLTRVPRR